MMTYKKQSDNNQQDIMDYLRARGVSVVSIHRLGGGIPDLLAGYRNRTYLFEVKNSEYSCKLTPKEEEFANNWKGQYAVVISGEEAWEIIEDDLEDEDWYTKI